MLPSIVKMTTDKSESLHLFKFLCQKIGSEKVVKQRRLIYTITDAGCNKLQSICSGSRAEGLDLKGSDTDVMVINSSFKVYESKSHDVLQSKEVFPFIMDTEDTLPCFTKLLFYNPFQFYDQFQNYSLFIQDMLQIDCFGRYLLSNELYKINQLQNMSIHLNEGINNFKVHGPCITDQNDIIDCAWVLKCDQWISSAQIWVTRSHTTWPSPNLISKITSCGVLFVPVGCKGSVNENVEWRISFSVAEKFLITSFNHTQILCYAVLKILLKQIIEEQIDLRGLLCSYFIKTMMFWILEETQPFIWRPDNIISCFKACLQRLIYCIEYSTLLHYFIPDNNFFYLRFNSTSKNKLISILNTLYSQGIHSFAFTETLSDYPRLTDHISSNTHIKSIIQTIQSFQFQLKREFKNVLHHMLHFSRTSLSADIFTLFLAHINRDFPERKKIYCELNNKNQYYMNKYDLSCLLIGLQSNAASGWIKLASYFYVQKNYLTSLQILNYALWKCTDEKMYMFSCSNHAFLKQKKESMLTLTKHWKLNKVFKMITVWGVPFDVMSPFIPPELQMEVTQNITIFPPVQFAHFLRFLCYYRLHDLSSCKYVIHQLERTFGVCIICKCRNEPPIVEQYAMIFLGIAYQMMGETN